MTALLRQLDRWHASGVLGQLVRFGITGVAVTLLYDAIYWPLATYGNRLIPLGEGAEWPVVAGAIAFLIAVAVGKVAHGRISFRGHGTRNSRTAHRFLVVQLFGFALNQCFIWVLTGPLVHGQTWWPMVPATLVTPLITFGLQRNWVFA